jgi:2,3-bisphosphoglycerate-independent phosphoglycerate mutase
MSDVNNNLSSRRPKPVVLIILDGWGVAPPAKGNAVALARTPFIDNLVKTYPAMTLAASGEAVGLSWGEAGNSEVGHLNLGAGRVVFQELNQIDRAIKDRSFFTNEKLLAAAGQVKKNKSALHLLGLVSSGKIHSSLDHLQALLKFCSEQKIKKVFLHLFLDGRDAPYNSGQELIVKIKQQLVELRVGKIATVSGRFYAMDRDNHWERTALAYQAIVGGQAEQIAADAAEAIATSYERKVFDEEFVPLVITDNGQPLATINNHDAVIFFNFRADRALQLAKALALPSFEKFPTKKFNDLLLVTFTSYDHNLPCLVAFAPEKINDSLAKVIAEAGLTQLHLAETEKYAHVTFFFDGFSEEKLAGEDWELAPSLNIPAYDQKPAMSAKAVAGRAVKAIMSDKYDFLVVNFANPDMVGHSGNLKAAVKACEAVDKSVKQIVETVLAKAGVALVVADHGNAEQLINLQSGQIDSDHNTSPVPLIIVGKEWEGKTAGWPEVPNSDLSLVQPAGKLADVAPTILKIMNLPKPQSITGQSLL